jgi:hypothetical protein
MMIRRPRAHVDDDEPAARGSDVEGDDDIITRAILRDAARFVERACVNRTATGTVGSRG